MGRLNWAISGGLAALVLGACSEDRAGEAPSGAAVSQGAQEEGELSALDAAAERACGAGDEQILAALPQGASFSSRAGDARVVVGCRLDDHTGVHRIRSTALPESARTQFDLAIAAHMRHGLRAGDERSGTGAYRERDGGFCAIQTDREVSRAVCEAAREAAPLEASEG